MGLGGISIWQLLILGFIVMMIFGTKKLKNLGEDLGGAIHGFKKAMDEGKEPGNKDQDKLSSTSGSNHTVDAKAEKVDADK